MQKKTFFAYVIAIAGVVILSGVAVSPALSRQAQKPMNATTSQGQSADQSYAYVPQQPYAGPRYGQCWIATDLSRPYGYRSSCANPASSDPSLDPTYNPEW